MYKYAVQNLHRKQVHVISVPRHYKPSEILTAIGDETEELGLGEVVHADAAE